MAISFRLLGTPRLEGSGQAIEVDTRKAIALLAYLALAGSPIPRETLAALLWPEYDDTNARAALRRTLSTARAAVGADRLIAGRQAVRLDLEEVELDVLQFIETVALIRAHGHPLDALCPDCLPLLEKTVALYRGDFLAGFSLRDSVEWEDWQRLQSELLQRELGDALDGLVATLIEIGDLERAIEPARRRLSLDPLHEPAHRQLMQLYSWTGRRSAAVRQYRECVRILEAELAVEPLEETTALYRAIKERSEGSPRPQSTGPRTQEAAHLPLVGRSAEWDALRASYEAMQNGSRVVVLEGEAGIGKTRLAQELVQTAQRAGSRVVAVRCFEGESGLAYAPIVELLRGAVTTLAATGELSTCAPQDLSEVGRLFPAIESLVPAIPPTSPMESPGAHARFLDALTTVLLASPLVIAVDDLQWADASSLEFLGFLIRHMEGHRTGLVLISRAENARQWMLPRPLRQPIREAKDRGWATVLRLERLERENCYDLIRMIRPSDDAVTVGDWLYKESEGLPLFISEYLAAMESDSGVPHGVRDLLLTRVASLSDSAAQVLGAAAVIGRAFDFDSLRAAAGRDEEMIIQSLEELTAQGMVRELDVSPSGSPQYDFSHDKLRTVVYEQTSLARRRLLHRRVADALVRRSQREAAGQIAHHYRLAGDTVQAAVYFREAGMRARNLYANAEALAHFGTALELGSPHVPELQEAIGDLHALLGEYRAAVTTYEKAASALTGMDLARIERKLGRTHDRWGEWDLAENYYRAALQTMGAEAPPAERARVYADWSMTAYHQGDPSRAASLAHSALQYAEDGNDLPALIQAHNLLGVLAARADLARDHLEHSLALARQTDDGAAELAATSNLSLVYAREGDLDAAYTLALQALALSRRQGDRHREAAVQNALADLLHAQGKPEDAMEHLMAAVVIYAEIGVDEDTYHPEVWKLAVW